MTKVQYSSESSVNYQTVFHLDRIQMERPLEAKLVRG